MRRVFLGIDLSNDLKNRLEILKARYNLSNLPIKLVEPENSHIAIKFLDNLTEEQVSVVSKLIKEQINEIEPFEVVVSNSLIFLNIQKPKVLSLKIISSELNKFGTQLITLLDELDFITNDHREYIPHLTLGRIKATLNDYEKDKIASIQFNGNMIINAFHLFESLLTSTGPKYNIIEEYKL